MPPPPKPPIPISTGMATPPPDEGGPPPGPNTSASVGIRLGRRGGGSFFAFFVCFSGSLRFSGGGVHGHIGPVGATLTSCGEAPAPCGEAPPPCGEPPPPPPGGVPAAALSERVFERSSRRRAVAARSLFG